LAELSSTVVVVGAGPVGLTLAIDLASRGVDVLVAETRHRGEPPSVKCNHVSARSMEVFRRLGAVEKVRDAGLPADYPHDVAYRVTTTGLELARIPIPCRRDRFTATTGPDTGWPTPEPPHRINQIFLEPILFQHAAQMGSIRLLNRVTVHDVRQTPDGVVAEGRYLDGGDGVRLSAQYLVGCDGGRSLTRRKIGARFEGVPVVQRVQSTYLRAPDLLGRLSFEPAWGTFSLNARRCGNVYAIDGRERWLVHNYLNEDEPGFEAVDRDACLRAILGVGDDFKYQVISKEDWTGRRLIANRFRDRRVFICGDAAHIWAPFAGYGMNAGIADAVDLAWLLAAHLDGWADVRILDAYEAERHPITEQVSHFAMRHALEVSKQRMSVPDTIEQPGPEGDAVRASIGQSAYELNVQQYCAAGLNFGYFYDESPIIAYDGAPHPAYTMGSFEPSTVPGCRLPHQWLTDGRSLYDALGPAYTLVVFDPRADSDTIARRASLRDLPLNVLKLDGAEQRADEHPALVLARPDLHIAWRGNVPPDDIDGLLDLITAQ
jgi:2-polyprenyl-6-methoxyphenol hydroxylase-like FAD-dependent oxidoreductase